jgi:UDP-N-acetylmuramate dehydrogenase
MSKFRNFEKLLPGIKRNVLLKNYTTFKIGGKAQFFFVAKEKEELIKAIRVAKKFKLPFFILGRGSNVLVADEGYNGLVIKTQSAKRKAQSNNLKLKTIYAEAGTALALVVSEATKKGLTGLEWAVGIPGTVGGAIWGNAGAFKNSMQNIVKKVEVLNSKTLKIKKFKNKDCKFSYRESIFKKNSNLIILSATLQLKKGNKKEIEKKIKEYLNYRKGKQPLNLPSAGSVFKNPPGFSAGELGEEDKSSSSRLAAARLIEECGLKGKRVGNVKISEKHANFIVNLGGGKAKDVKKLIKIIKNKIKNKSGIILEEEIVILS